MSIISEFKTFINQGNVVDLAVGVIIGGAFGKVVSSLVNDLLMPPIGVVLGGVDFKNLKVIIKDASIDAGGKPIEAVSINYGMFIQSIVDFVIIALAIFFIIKAMNKMRRKPAEVAATPPEPSAEAVLLTQIRDLLKK